MTKQSKLLSVSLPIIFLIISIFWPLFNAKTPSFLDLLINFEVQNLSVILIYSIAVISLFAGILLTKNKNKFSIVFNAISFVLFIILTSANPNFRTGPGLVFAIFVSGIFTSISYYQFIDQFSMTISDIVEMAMYISLAILFDMFLKIRIGANGGSISISMVPLFVMVLRKGFVKGFIGCGLIFGLINCLLDGYGFIYYPLDYLMAFGSLAVLGLFRPLLLSSNRRLTIKGVIFLVIGLLLGSIGRLFFATISGVKMWGLLTYWESLVYNAAYLLPSLGLVIILMVGLYKPLLLIEKKYPSR